MIGPVVEKKALTSRDVDSIDGPDQRFLNILIHRLSIDFIWFHPSARKDRKEDPEADRERNPTDG